MVRIRLRKVGFKGQVSFRIVAAEREHPRDGRFIEELGHYNPRTHPATIVIKEDRLYHWLKNGAQPSDAVQQLLKSTGALERYNRFKAGEPIETLVAEAQAAAQARNTSASTLAASALRADKPKKPKKEKKS
ncbi:MAG: 30S ribosomal protein S16 [Anaerolineales bacterium]|nr:30S ribosomal protein S16 [Anaerolineales bacterium]